jgi:hypothetical protein
VQRPERVLPPRSLLTEERQRQVDHLVVEAGPERLHVRRHSELGEATYVVGMDQLQVRDVVPEAAAGHGLEGVERFPGAPVADGVHVDLETLGVQPRDVPPQRRRVDERVAAVAGGVTAAVEVRPGQRGGAVLGDPVLHHLDAGRPEPAVGELQAAFDQ